MSFWKTSTGQEATGEVKETNFDPLKKGWYTCMLEEVINKEWTDNDGELDRYVNIKARVVAGECQNRVVFCKLKIYKTNGKFYKAEARDSALQKIVKLYSILKAKLPDGEPDDRSLSQLSDKPIDLYFGVWQDQQTKEPAGNFIGNIAPKGTGGADDKKSAPVRTAPVKAGTARPMAQTASDDPENDPPF